MSILLLRCVPECIPGAVEIIDSMMCSPTSNIRAVMHVVDCVLRRGMKGDVNRDAAVLSKVMGSRLSTWLRVLLLSKRAPEQLEKSRKMIQSWNAFGVLPMDGLLPLLELMDAPASASEDSQQSQQSLDFSQSQPWTESQGEGGMRQGRYSKTSGFREKIRPVE